MVVGLREGCRQGRCLFLVQEQLQGRPILRFGERFNELVEIKQRPIVLLEVLVEKRRLHLPLKIRFPFFRDDHGFGNIGRQV